MRRFAPHGSHLRMTVMDSAPGTFGQEPPLAQSRYPLDTCN